MARKKQSEKPIELEPEEIPDGAAVAVVALADICQIRADITLCPDPDALKRIELKLNRIEKFITAEWTPELRAFIDRAIAALHSAEQEGAKAA